MLENNAFDLIFLDVNMPVLSGFEVVRKAAQAAAEQVDTPVIFVTLYGDFLNREPIGVEREQRFHCQTDFAAGIDRQALCWCSSSVRIPNVKSRMLRAAGAGGQPGDGRQRQSQTVGAPCCSGRGGQRGKWRMKEWQVTRAAVDDKVKALTEALAQESKRREEAEQQAAANAKLQSKLEAAQAENQKGV